MRNRNVKLKCNYLGDFNIPNGRRFSIYVDVPILFETYNEVTTYSVYLCFKKIDGNIVLFMYDKEDQVIDEIRWEEWWKYKVIELKQSSYDSVVIGNEDFLPNSENWNTLFGVENLDNDWFENLIGIENTITLANNHIL